jgi:hypothetical protein
MRSPQNTNRLLVLLAAASLCATACDESHRVTGTTMPPPSGGSGPVVEQTFAVSGVSRVHMAAVGTLFIRQGAQEELLVRARQRILDRLEVDTLGGELLLDFRGGPFQNVSEIEFHLTLTNPLERVSLPGVGRIQASNLTVGALELLQSGVGSIDFDNLQAQSLSVAVSGVGDLAVSGSVRTQTVVLSGMGNYRAGQLASDEADVRIRQRGSATVRVRDRLDVTISGSGSVYYYGDPVVTRNITGSGRCVKHG